MDSTDALILLTVHALRAEHGACTGRAVADEIGMSTNATKERLIKLRAAGLLEQTDMPGSLRLTRAGLAARRRLARRRAAAAA